MKYVWTVIAALVTYGMLSDIIESNLDTWDAVVICTVIVMFWIDFIINQFERDA